MSISVRSHLIAGTAALAVAGVTAVAPLSVNPASPSASAPALADVALAALNTPIQELLGSINVTQTYLLGAFYEGADGIVPGAGAINWTDAGFDQVGGDTLNFLLANEPALGFYSNVGIVPQLVNQATPILRQLQTNLFDYINVVFTGLIDTGIALNAGVWAFPPALVDAAELALEGDFQAALGVIGEAIVTPIVSAGEALFGAGAYVLDNVVARAVAVLSAIPEIVTTYVGSFVGGAGLLIEKSVAIATEWVDNLTAGDLAGAWNTAVAGLFGPSGLPGTALNLSIGAGVQTGPINSEEDIPENFVPSVRTAVQGTAWSIQNALTATPPEAETLPAAVAEVPAAEPVVAAEPIAVDVPADVDVESAGTPVTVTATGAGVEDETPASASRAVTTPKAAAAPAVTASTGASATADAPAPAKKPRAQRAGRGASAR